MLHLSDWIGIVLSVCVIVMTIYSFALAIYGILVSIYGIVLSKRYPSGSCADPITKKLRGFGRARACYQTKVNKYLCALVISMLSWILVCFLKVRLVPFVHAVSECRSGVFAIWSKMAPGFIEIMNKSNQVCPGGGNKRSRGCPGVPKNRSQTKRATAGYNQANGSSMARTN